MVQFDLAWMIWLVLGLVAAVWFVGGYLFSAGGRWRDRDRIVELSQFGPWVWGRCIVPGGVQRYWGKIWFGDLILTRRDFGKEHLQTLGFSEMQAQAVEGEVMVRLKFKSEKGVLRGHLWGTRFQFNPRTQEVISVKATAPEEREWVRVESISS